MKRGRKQDDTLPPSRSREIQRAFRQRRSDYIRGLEQRVEELESEVDQALSRLGEPLRYTAAEVIAARAASRKKQKNKSKHNLAQFLDPSPASCAVESRENSESPGSKENHPSMVHSLEGPAESSSGSSYCVRPSFAPNENYVLRDASYNATLSRGSPEYCPESFSLDFGSEIPNEFENLKSPHSPERSKLMFNPWDSECNARVGRCSKSPQSVVSLHSSSISPPEYRPPSSNFGIFLGAGSVSHSHHEPSRKMSDSFRHGTMKIQAPSGSLPGLLADSSNQFGPMPGVGFEAYDSSSEINSTPYDYQEAHPNGHGNYDSCSYPFNQTAKDNSSSKMPPYSHDSPATIFTNRDPLAEQQCEPSESLSTLVAIASTRLAGFQSRKIGFGYQSSTSQPLLPLSDYPVAQLSNEQPAPLNPSPILSKPTESSH